MIGKWPFEKSTVNYAGRIYPKLSIIVPSYNQGPFIEETILSILNQDYPNLELIIIDGGSSDETVSVIEKYRDQIEYFVSEKDNGQSHALNKGMMRATGEWIGWLNSDDMYLPGAFHNIFSNEELLTHDFFVRYESTLLFSDSLKNVKYLFLYQA